jgi:hypothetical protein
LGFKQAVPTLPKATRKSLGPLIATYRYRPLQWRESLTYLLLGLVAVGIPLAYGLYRFRDGYNNHGELAAVTWSRPWFLLAGFALICSSLLLVHRMRLAGRFIAVYQNGLALAVGQKQLLRWEEISGIATDMIQPGLFANRRGVQYRAKIIPNIGRPILLAGAYQNLPECITRIKARLYPLLVPELKSSFSTGKWLYFGPVAIQRKTLRLGKNQFSWTQVKRVSIVKGVLVVELVDQTCKRIPVAKIPNFELLLQLIDQGVTS